MANWKKLGQSARRTAQNLKEKNRRAALANRLRLVVHCEEQAAEKEYLALGRYYYNALRSKDNAIAESHCARIDAILQRLYLLYKRAHRCIRGWNEAQDSAPFIRNSWGDKRRI